MRTNLSYAMNHATNESLVPPEMLRGGSAVVRSFIDVMMMYGVERLDVGHYAHGSVLLLAPRLRLMKEVDVPAWLAGSRKQAMLHLAHLMLIMGLLGIEISLEKSELETVEERWRSCERLSDEPTTDIGQLLGPEGAVKIESQGPNENERDPDSGQERGAPDAG